MLRDLGRDSLVRKDARVDTLGGLTDLMAAAEAGIGAWPRDLPMLVLYGQHEQVLPAPAVRQALASIKAHHANSAMHVRVYDTGYHLLLRDIGAQRVLDDVAAWVATLNSYKNTGALFTDGWTQSLPYAKRSQPI
jgi:alpha-beta hydrolase superfamily lysophospholipase